LNMRNHAVAVRAVDTVEFFDGVQVGQFEPVENDVVPASGPRYAIGAEMDHLVDRHREVQKRDRNDHRVDDRGCSDRKKSGIPDVVCDVSPKRSMSIDDFLLEDHEWVLQLVSQLFGAFLEGIIQLFLELRHSVEDLGKRLAHGCLL
jgi:hypothetical protein